VTHQNGNKTSQHGRKERGSRSHVNSVVRYNVRDKVSLCAIAYKWYALLQREELWISLNTWQPH
ncbi:MAG: hypothetical protein E7G69_24335, partial [Enterobacter sp.]|nr:hypothetical protein [Enterobacter sp.]